MSIKIIRGPDTDCEIFAVSLRVAPAEMRKFSIPKVVFKGTAEGIAEVIPGIIIAETLISWIPRKLSSQEI